MILLLNVNNILIHKATMIIAITQPEFAKYHTSAEMIFANNTREQELPSHFVCDGWCVCEQVIKKCTSTLWNL